MPGVVGWIVQGKFWKVPRIGMKNPVCKYINMTYLVLDILIAY